uniref:Inactive aspartic protease Lma-p54 n=1 Tax=Rhyparobia maderae TaxID=36963 RepID=Q963B3_RHYMA|nr:inactive aspartic protease Lma-p54 [Rhyparobia maderae]
MFLNLLLISCAVLSTVSAHSVPLRKRVVAQFINTQYAGTVGADKGNYLLVFDSGSPYILLASQECLGGACDCASTQKYVGQGNPNAKSITVTYFDTESATGKPTNASVTIANLTSPHQGIILVDEIGYALCTLTASGVVGLAPPTAATQPGFETVVDSFATEGLIANVFSVHHARYPDGEHFGELVLGGVNSKFVVGDFTSAKLQEPDSWKIKLDQVLIGDKNVADDNTLGFVDTSKAIILGPKAQVDEINEEIGCTPTTIGSTEYCELDCSQTSQLPEFTFVISGTNFNISAEYYIQRNGDLCYSGFMPSSLGYYMIGDFFIDHYYTVYNWEKKEMQFAIAREDA